jgi:PAS domain S-box-containing protein
MSFWRFTAPPPDAIALDGAYDYWLVALSLVIASTGAFAMLRAVQRFRAAKSRGLRTTWAVSGAISMGFGIWAMHFTGMIALALPVQMDYDVWLTAASLVPALAGSLAAVYVLGAPVLDARRVLMGAALLGGGIGFMHYTGMEAMHFDGVFVYDSKVFSLSLVAAYAIAYVALRLRPALLALRLPVPSWSLELIVAVVLGGAVASMHYLAMASASFYTTGVATGVHEHVPGFVLEAVIVGLVLIAGVIWLGSVFDQQFATVSASLRQSEALNTAVIMSMADAHFLADATGTILSINPAAATMFGYSAEELIGANVSMLVPAPHKHRHDGYLQRYVDTRERHIIGANRRDLRAVRKSGELFPIELRVTDFERDRQLFFSATVRDLSEYAASIENTRRLMAAVEQAAEAIVIVDHEMRVVFANPAFWRQTGADAASGRGRTLDSLVWRADAGTSYAEMCAHVRAGKTWSAQVTTMGIDGAPRHEALTTAPVVTAGTSTCFIHVRRNVTEHVLMEQQLRHSQKLESIGQLSAGIAHELNTPSQFVRDNLLFLKDAYKELLALVDKAGDSPRFAAAAATSDLEYLREEVPRALDQSVDGMNRITTIVRAMKEFSHQGKEKAAADLNHAIESTITVATNEWKYVADVVFDLDRTLPLVPCVLDEFNRVILNIVVNAAHAIGDVVQQGALGKGTITVSTRRMDDLVEIRIADTGTGMPPDVKARIFEPFFTTKEVGRGTGQGLSIAYAIVVEKHGGSIDVQTERGKGSCFIIRLPLHDSPMQATAAA